MFSCLRRSDPGESDGMGHVSQLQHIIPTKHFAAAH